MISKAQSAALAVPIIAVALAFGSPAEAAEPAHWTYSGSQGPAHWAGLSREFAACEAGREQSPIDIRDARKAELPPIRFDYKPAPLRLVDNGHTIQVNYAPGSRITVGADSYELVQFHFHRPSEERVNGTVYAMVAHLVHRSAEGKLAVVGVLLESGGRNGLLEALWGNLPPAKEQEVAIRAVTIDAAGLLPADRGYYTFPGSLTTPPCSEGVRWFVLKRPVRVSADQIDTFAKRYPGNARPVQPLNARVIQQTP